MGAEASRQRGRGQSGVRRDGEDGTRVTVTCLEPEDYDEEDEEYDDYDDSEYDSGSGASLYDQDQTPELLERWAPRNPSKRSEYSSQEPSSSTSAKRDFPALTAVQNSRFKSSNSSRSSPTRRKSEGSSDGRRTETDTNATPPQPHPVLPPHQPPGATPRPIIQRLPKGRRNDSSSSPKDRSSQGVSQESASYYPIPRPPASQRTGGPRRGSKKSSESGGSHSSQLQIPEKGLYSPDHVSLAEPSSDDDDAVISPIHDMSPLQSRKDDFFPMSASTAAGGAGQGRRKDKGRKQGSVDGGDKSSLLSGSDRHSESSRRSGHGQKKGKFDVGNGDRSCSPEQPVSPTQDSFLHEEYEIDVGEPEEKNSPAEPLTTAEKALKQAEGDLLLAAFLRRQMEPPPPPKEVPVVDGKRIGHGFKGHENELRLPPSQPANKGGDSLSSSGRPRASMSATASANAKKRKREVVFKSDVQVVSEVRGPYISDLPSTDVSHAEARAYHRLLTALSLKNGITPAAAMAQMMVAQRQARQAQMAAAYEAARAQQAAAANGEAPAATATTAVAKPPPAPPPSSPSPAVAGARTATTVSPPAASPPSASRRAPRPTPLVAEQLVAAKEADTGSRSTGVQSSLSLTPTTTPPPQAELMSPYMMPVEYEAPKLKKSQAVFPGGAEAAAMEEKSKTSRRERSKTKGRRQRRSKETKSPHSSGRGESRLSRAAKLQSMEDIFRASMNSQGGLVRLGSIDGGDTVEGFSYATLLEPMNVPLRLRQAAANLEPVASIAAAAEAAGEDLPWGSGALGVGKDGDDEDLRPNWGLSAQSFGPTELKRARFNQNDAFQLQYVVGMAEFESTSSHSTDRDGSPTARDGKLKRSQKLMNSSTLSRSIPSDHSRRESLSGSGRPSRTDKKQKLKRAQHSVTNVELMQEVQSPRGSSSNRTPRDSEMSPLSPSKKRTRARQSASVREESTAQSTELPSPHAQSTELPRQKKTTLQRAPRRAMSPPDLPSSQASYFGMSFPGAGDNARIPPPPAKAKQNLPPIKQRS